MKYPITILALLISYTASSQLYVSGGADVFIVNNNANLTVNGDLQVNGAFVSGNILQVNSDGRATINGNFILNGNSNVSIFDHGSVVVTGNAIINPGTLLRIGVNSGGEGELTIQGDIVTNSNLKESRLNNSGTLSLGGNWNDNLNYGDNDGTIVLNGIMNQTISFDDLQTTNLIINKGGLATYTGNELTISGDVDFQRGVMVINQPTRFVVAPNATVSGGSVDSYLQGYMIHQGIGNIRFPLGYQGEYGPLTILEVDLVGSTPEYTASYTNPNASNPQIDTTVPLYEQLLGVSSRGLWEVSLSSGSSLSTLETKNIGYEISYDNEQYLVTNEIRRKFKSPVIASARAASGLFNSLGVETYITTDSLVNGTITSEFAVDLNDPTKFTLGGNGEKTFFLAIGLAPRIDPSGLYYIPEIFSPNAQDVNNQRFKVFGELLEDTEIQIYNRFGALVYREKTSGGARQEGWDGVSQKTKREEPTGTYFYYAQILKESGELIKKRGSFYLIR